MPGPEGTKPCTRMFIDEGAPDSEWFAAQPHSPDQATRCWRPSIDREGGAFHRYSELKCVLANEMRITLHNNVEWIESGQ